MTKQIDEEGLEMCNLGMAVEMKGMAKGMEKGMAKGMEKGILSSIEKLMKTMKWNAHQAMEALEIPQSEQEHYAAMIDHNSGT